MSGLLHKPIQRYTLGISLVCLLKGHKYPVAYEVQGQCDIFSFDGEWNLRAQRTCQRKNCYWTQKIRVFTKVNLFPDSKG